MLCLYRKYQNFLKYIYSISIIESLSKFTVNKLYDEIATASVVVVVVVVLLRPNNIFSWIERCQYPLFS